MITTGTPTFFDHAPLRYGTADNARHRPTSGTQDVSYETGSGNNFWTESGGEAIPTAITAGSTLPDHACVTADIGRRSPTSETQKLFPLPVSWPTFWVPDVGRCLVVSVLPYLGRTWSEMWGAKRLESRRHRFPFKSYFHFRFVSTPF